MDHYFLVSLFPSPKTLQINPGENKVWSGKMSTYYTVPEVNHCNFSVTGNI